MKTPDCPVEFAFWWTQRFRGIPRSAWTPQTDAFELFADIHRTRNQRWIECLSCHSTFRWPFSGLNSHSRDTLRYVVLREVLVSEPLVRVIAAASQSILAGGLRERIQPMAHQVFLAHRQVRCLVLEHLMRDLDHGGIWASSLNRLRISLEEWTDLLLGRHAAKTRVTLAPLLAYGFRENRIREYACEELEISERLSPALEGWLWLQGIRKTMRTQGRQSGPTHMDPQASDPRLQQLAASMVAPDAFLDISVSQSHRIEEQLNEIEQMLDLS